MSARWWPLAVVVAAASACGAGSTPVVAPRGLTGETTFEAVGPSLRATLDQGPRSAIVVRLTEITDPPIPPDDATALRRYRAEFIGHVAGSFDLRDALERRDGAPLSALPPLPVEIVSELPAGHGTDLFDTAREPYRLTSRYRIGMALFAAAWIAVPVVVLVRRALRRAQVEPAIPSPPPPTLADQLRPLIDAARRDGLSVAERGRLELLLMGFWRERLDLDGLSPAEAAARLRSDPRSSPLLLAMERWLHAPGAGSPRAEEDVAALLEPYRSAPPRSEVGQPERRQ